MVFPSLWGFVDNETRTEECRFGVFNLTRAGEPGLRHHMNGRDCIRVAAAAVAVLRRGLRAVSFVPLQLRRGLAAVR